MHYDNRGRKLLLAAQRAGSSLRAAELAVWATLAAQHGRRSIEMLRIPAIAGSGVDEVAARRGLASSAGLSARCAANAAVHLLASLPSDEARARFVAEVRS